MATIQQVCRHVRSKNAGPYWVTIDLFFNGPDTFERFSRSPALSPQLISNLYGADPALVKFYPVASLNTLKISYPRTSPQGGEVERDMHCGQQYVRLLDVELDIPA
jgi:hypothetical protein